MNDFEKGMNSIGQLLPPPYPCSEYPSRDSAWNDTAKSFRQAGDDLRFALKEYENAKQESKQTL